MVCVLHVYPIFPSLYVFPDPQHMERPKVFVASPKNKPQNGDKVAFSTPISGPHSAGPKLKVGTRCR